MRFFKIISLIFLLLGSNLFIPSFPMARHRCPETPSINPSILSTSQIAIASIIASSIATGRTSNTSGCDAGHPSKRFYRPKGAIFLDQTFEQVVEESSKGQGQHLDALAVLAGCKSYGFSLFSKTLQKNYKQLFIEGEYSSIDQKSDQVWNDVEKMIISDAQLKQMCLPTS